jgi:hypothetical protein
MHTGRRLGLPLVLPLSFEVSQNKSLVQDKYLLHQTTQDS